MLTLVPVNESHIEWLRVARNKPEQYRYFRQDRPITEVEQRMWWKNLNKARVRLFILQNEKDQVGYVGFNPLDQYSQRGEFGLFILKEHQGNGYGIEGLNLLLDKGFNELNLRLIYSDCLDYPGENRIGFYEKIGFVRYPDNCQGVRYKKQGEWVNSIRFYMTKEMYDSLHKSELVPRVKEAVASMVRKVGKGSGFRSGKGRVKPVSK